MRSTIDWRQLSCSLFLDARSRRTASTSTGCNGGDGCAAGEALGQRGKTGEVSNQERGREPFRRRGCKRRWIVRDAARDLPAFFAVYAVVVAFTLVGRAVELPFRILRWQRGRRERLDVRSAATVATDSMKDLAVTVILIGLPIAGWIRSLASPGWWVGTIAGAALVCALFTLIGPALTRLYVRMEPLADEAQSESVIFIAAYRSLINQVTSESRYGHGPLRCAFKPVTG